MTTTAEQEKEAVIRLQVRLLSPAQRRDLVACYETWHRTVGTFDWPKGKWSRLRTGKSLRKIGLVEWANRLSANRSKGWTPSPFGVEVAKAILKEDEERRQADVKAVDASTGSYMGEEGELHR